MAAAGGAPLPGSRVPGALAAPDPALCWRRVFPGEARQLSELRRWLAGLLPECPARYDVACIATELGTNAIRHTASGRGGWFAVAITRFGTMVRVSVADGGAPAGPRLIDDPEGETGRGLMVVRGLSARTGVSGGRRGRLVWADVPWDDLVPEQDRDPGEAAVREGLAELGSRFRDVPAWFGRSTMQWWALVGGQLVSAASAPELAGLLSRAVSNAPRSPPAARDPAPGGLPSRLTAPPQFSPRAGPQPGRDAAAGSTRHSGPAGPTSRAQRAPAEPEGAVMPARHPGPGWGADAAREGAMRAVRSHPPAADRPGIAHRSRL